jgi:O-acetyl-ADP-ribose deacetylase (regulator of RNase III)
MIYLHDETSLVDWFEQQKEPVGIIQSCNCFHVQGAGLAKQISTKYPEALIADKGTGKGDMTKMGKFSIAKTQESPVKYVFNLYGQYNYGRDKRYTSYDAVVDGLERIKIKAKELGLKKLGLPCGMGCRLGGANWEIVKVIIMEIFPINDNSGIDLHICQYDSI